MLDRITLFRSVLCFPLGIAACAGNAQWGPSWDLAAGALFTRYTDPLGPFHGPQTGRSAEGVGFMLGACHEWKHERKAGLLAGLLMAYSTSGYYYDESRGSYGPEFKADGLDAGRRSMQVTTLDAPVMIVWRGLPSLRFELGVMHRLLLRANERWHGERLDGPGPEPLDRRVLCYRSLEPLEVGWCAGALIEGPARIGMGLRYFQGFTNLDRSTGSSASYGRQIQLAIVYRLSSHRAGSAECGECRTPFLEDAPWHRVGALGPEFQEETPKPGPVLFDHDPDRREHAIRAGEHQRMDP